MRRIDILIALAVVIALLVILVLPTLIVGIIVTSPHVIATCSIN